ncbi:YciI family protein [Microbacterium dauci]|uniref:YciI family protein n=1 Tax=Microbacterium dauci TaxID=3048008 RepID=A0ABT6ZAG2_9MICO|nr:YciI family protein [Microbacterium sp. LX3-4]MDJ1113152.1 YciI family protein [Microbacterium sp. LX3-4]
MTKYLVSFPGAAMDLTPEEFRLAGIESREVIREAKAAGVYVFGGGIAEDVPSVMVSADGTATDDTYPQTAEFDGGFTVLEVATREEALEWARKIAAACRCAQELREFMYDPES